MQLVLFLFLSKIGTIALKMMGTVIEEKITIFLTKFCDGMNDISLKLIHIEHKKECHH